MFAQLFQRDDFKNLIQCSDAARKNTEGVRRIEQRVFADMKRGKNLQFAEFQLLFFAALKQFINDACDLSSGFEGGFGDRAHHTDMTGAVNQTDAVFPQKGSQRACGFNIGRIAAGGRAAENPKRFNFCHILHSSCFKKVGDMPIII